jgi:hypothetical protein
MTLAANARTVRCMSLFSINCRSHKTKGRQDLRLNDL